MPYYFKTGIILTLLMCLTSCNKDDNDYTAYFGGEIKDPLVPYVLFSKDNKVIDTIPLDANNRFFVKFDSLTPGLYNFKHEPDYQYVYFDKNDSLMVSLNTTDFDQSVVFSGRGERKNNFMMELFLAHEEDRSHIMIMITTSPSSQKRPTLPTPLERHFMKNVKKKLHGVKASIFTRSRG